MRIKKSILIKEKKPEKQDDEEIYSKKCTVNARF
jgi:hypothetical protein